MVTFAPYPAPPPRTEWLEMKQLYRQMQKEQMKQLKSESHREREGTAPQATKKPFISHCLLRVETTCDGEGAITADRLRVCVPCDDPS